MRYFPNLMELYEEIGFKMTYTPLFNLIDNAYIEGPSNPSITKVRFTRYYKLNNSDSNISVCLRKKQQII